MENKVLPYMAEWTINFVKNKDVISRKIEKIETGKSGFDLYVKYRDKEQYFIIAPNAADIDSAVQKLNNNSHFTIVTLNSKDNFNLMIKNWNRLAEFKFLSLVFINPFSELDKKWIIYPHTHDKICDASSLKTGLKSMFDMVEPIEEEELISKIG